MNVNRRVAQGALTRASLVSAGRQLFGAQGHGGTSIEDIASAVGVTKGAVYHHFSGKDALFRAVYEQVKRDITDQVAPSFLLPNPWDALLAGCQATLDAYLDPEVRRIALFDGRAVLGWEAAREIDSRYGAVVLRGALRSAMNAGVVERLPLAPLAQMLNGALSEACVLIADSPDLQTASVEVGSVVRRILEGLRT